MSMKQSIQLKLGQHLTMTPQLQQAIRLLQLSSLELTAEVQDALDISKQTQVQLEVGPDSRARNILDPARSMSASTQGWCSAVTAQLRPYVDDLSAAVPAAESAPAAVSAPVARNIVIGTGDVDGR